jgi:NAD(P)-dependent dehydrogenase (short-subunit alcohol dehydrogenase family)
MYSATSDIGFHIAHQLAIKGAKIYGGARNTQKAQDAEIRKDNLLALGTNLGDLKEVRQVAQQFVAKERLDISVNNAGL